MGIDRHTLDQVMKAFRPHATRLANMVIRGVVQRVNDVKKLQLLQLGGRAGQTIEGAKGAEHFQPYGFSSVPLEGAEAVVIFPNGDQSHPIVLSTPDRRYRPTAGQAGEVCLYTDEGDTIRLGRGHIVSVATDAGAGGQVRLGSDSASNGVLTTVDGGAFLTALAYAIGQSSSNAPGLAALTVLYNALTHGASPPTVTTLPAAWPKGSGVVKADD